MKMSTRINVVKYSTLILMGIIIITLLGAILFFTLSRVINSTPIQISSNTPPISVVLATRYLEEDATGNYTSSKPYQIIISNRFNGVRWNDIKLITTDKSCSVTRVLDKELPANFSITIETYCNPKNAKVVTNTAFGIWTYQLPQVTEILPY